MLFGSMSYTTDHHLHTTYVSSILLIKLPQVLYLDQNCAVVMALNLYLYYDLGNDVFSDVDVDK